MGEWLYSRAMAHGAHRGGPRPDGDAVTQVVTADGSHTLRSSRYGETFHSRYGAVAEARHVFLEGSGVGARLAAGAPTTVLEVGFGAGLNALLTLDAAALHGTPLRFASLEQALLPAGTLAALGYRAHLRRPELASAVLAWRAALSEPPPSRAALELGRSRLELLLGDATGATLPQGAHAVYHDAFSPSANPELWDAPFLASLFRALVPGGTLVSYTVQGALRRRLAATGFEVVKLAGPPGGKREVLRARKPGSLP